MGDPLIALSRTNIEGTLVVVASFVIFGGSVWMLTGAVFGNRLGYLISATSLFAFMIVLSSLWVFGAPGTNAYLGPKGELASWVTVATGHQLTSQSLPLVEQYPEGPWQTPKEAGLQAEVETAELVFQETLAEEATAELKAHGLEAETEIDPATFEINGLRFAEANERPVAMAQAFSAGGGPEVLVFGYKDPGDEPLPSWAFFIASLLGFVVHLPFLDRAERKRKAILTGGGQPVFRGPA